MEQSEEKSDHI